MIKEPTRITDSSSLAIDLLFISDSHKRSNNGVISVGLSDHLLVHCTRKLTKQPSEGHNDVTLRSLKKLWFQKCSSCSTSQKNQTKLMQGIVGHCIQNYGKNHGQSIETLYYDFQFGSRHSYYTEIYNSKCHRMVLLDLQKAFNTVNHTILLYELNAIGLDIMSSPHDVMCGVPQGSILGPLFLIYL